MILVRHVAYYIGILGLDKCKRPLKNFPGVGYCLACQVKELDLGYSTGRDRLLLRLPVVVRHLVDDDSPLSRWQSGPSGIGEDADSEIIVVVSCFRACHKAFCIRAYAEYVSAPIPHYVEPESLPDYWAVRHIDTQ